MKRGTWHFVSEATGLPIGRAFTGSARHLAANTPPGFVAVEGPGPEAAPSPAPDQDAAARLQRARLLAACDWVVTRAAERGEPMPAEWAQYRQALRDVPLQPGFPDSIQWPERPESST